MRVLLIAIFAIDKENREYTSFYECTELQCTYLSHHHDLIINIQQRRVIVIPDTKLDKNRGNSHIDTDKLMGQNN